MATPRRPNLVTAWGRHLLRRPEEITPFTLEEGAQMVGDPTSPEGARIKGGGVRLEPGWVVKGAGSTRSISHGHRLSRNRLV